MSYQKCPVCDGRGYSAGTTCTVCDGKKIISTLTGLPPKSSSKTLEANGRTYDIVDPAEIARANKEISEQMKIHRLKYLKDMQKQHEDFAEFRGKVRAMHDVPADIKKIVDDNFNELI